jgi:hypothetical protein
MRSFIVAAVAALAFASTTASADRITLTNALATDREATLPNVGETGSRHAALYTAQACKTGKPCGHTCIAKGKTCHVTPDGRNIHTHYPN